MLAERANVPGHCFRGVFAQGSNSVKPFCLLDGGTLRLSIALALLGGAQAQINKLKYTQVAYEPVLSPPDGPVRTAASATPSSRQWPGASSTRDRVTRPG